MHETPRPGECTRCAMPSATRGTYTGMNADGVRVVGFCGGCHDELLCLVYATPDVALARQREQDGRELRARGAEPERGPLTPLEEARHDLWMSGVPAREVLAR